MSETVKDIRAEYHPKPVPFRNFDWEAYEHDNCDMDSIVGLGATREEAIADFMERMKGK